MTDEGGDIIGKTFGHYLVLKKKSVTKTGKIKWLVLCRCGRQHTKYRTSLTHTSMCWYVMASKREASVGAFIDKSVNLMEESNFPARLPPDFKTSAFNFLDQFEHTGLSPVKYAPKTRSPSVPWCLEYITDDVHWFPHIFKCESCGKTTDGAHACLKCTAVCCKSCTKYKPGGSWLLEEIGQIMGITRERVRQIEEDSLLKLRKSLSGNSISKKETPESILSSKYQSGIWSNASRPFLIVKSPSDFSVSYQDMRTVSCSTPEKAIHLWNASVKEKYGDQRVYVEVRVRLDKEPTKKTTKKTTKDVVNLLDGKRYSIQILRYGYVNLRKFRLHAERLARRLGKAVSIGRGEKGRTIIQAHDPKF